MKTFLSDTAHIMNFYDYDYKLKFKNVFKVKRLS